MMRNILALAVNDFVAALKNKTLYLILFIPFFVFLCLKLIDPTAANPGPIKIGLIQPQLYAPHILQSLQAAEKFIAVTWLQSEVDARRLLKEKTVDGVLLGNEQTPDRLTLLVTNRESLQTLAILESFAALQQAAEGNRDQWIGEVATVYQHGVQRQTLPTWILMIVLLIGFIILPAQVAEEKEKKLLLALLQTPIREWEWLLAKVILGMVLTLIATLCLHLLGQFGVVHLFDYIALIVVGGFCFSSYGVLLGFLCRSQASARTLGVVFYLPHLLPSALSDFSQQLTVVAPLLPSYQFYEPLKSLLLEDGRLLNMPFAGGYLLLVGGLTFYLSYLLIKKRWLMG